MFRFPDETTTTLAADFECGWLANNQIVIYRPLRRSKAAWRAWKDCVQQTTANWPERRPYLALHDVRAVPIGYGMNKTRSIDSSLTSYFGRSAILTSPNVIFRITKFLANAVDEINQDNLQRQAFTDSDAALTWLQQGLVRA